MPTYVLRDGKLVPKETAPPLHQQHHAKRVHVQSDSMPPLKHMATGQIVDSKSEFRRQTKAAGCIEVGDDPAILRPQKPEYKHSDLKPLIYRAWEILTNR